MSEAESGIHDLLMRQVLGEPLSAADRARLESALGRDQTLRDERVELEKALLQLASSVATTPPRALRARVVSSVEASQPPLSRPVRARAARWPYALAASVSVLAILAGTILTMENRQLRRDMARQAEAARMLLEPNVVLSFAMQGAGAAERAAGVVLLDLDAKRASISISDLPVLPEGESYFLWAELKGKTVPCGQFSALADGTILTQFAIPVDSYGSPIQRLVLTVETGRRKAAPAGRVVMTSS